MREAVAAGDVTRATKLLGHLHDVSGNVVAGQRRGRTIGFPTANLHPESVLLPSDGVYAVVVRRLGAAPDAPLLRGVANLGVRPTLGAGRSLEAHRIRLFRRFVRESSASGSWPGFGPNKNFLT